MGCGFYVLTQPGSRAETTDIVGAGSTARVDRVEQRSAVDTAFILSSSSAAPSVGDVQRWCDEADCGKVVERFESGEAGHGRRQRRGRGARACVAVPQDYRVRYRASR